MTRLLVVALGYGLVGLGIIGFIFPVLPGFPFLIPGLILLSRHAPWARRLLLWIGRRHPKLALSIIASERWVLRRERRARVWGGRLFRRMAAR